MSHPRGPLSGPPNTQLEIHGWGPLLPRCCQVAVGGPMKMAAVLCHTERVENGAVLADHTLVGTR